MLTEGGLPDLVYGIDPGPKESALVIIDNTYQVVDRYYDENKLIDSILKNADTEMNHLACEFVQSYGNLVGRSVFFTCKAVGKFEAYWDSYGSFFLYARPTIKSGLIGSVSKAKDKYVRQALRQRFGRSKKGHPLEGISRHKWDALAVAVFHLDCISLGSKEWMEYE